MGEYLSAQAQPFIPQQQQRPFAITNEQPMMLVGGPATSALANMQGQVQLQDNQAIANSNQSLAAVNKALVPTNIAKGQSQLQQLNLQNDASQLSGLQAQQSQVLRQQQLYDAELSNIANDPTTTPDNFDQRLQRLDAQGNPLASQWIGRYSLKSIDQLKQLGSPSGLAAAAPGSSPANIPDGSQPTNFTRLFSQQSPQQLQGTMAYLDSVDAAIQRVQAARDPVSQYNTEIEKLPQLNASPVTSSDQVTANLAKFKAAVEPARNALQAQLIQTGAGLPVPKAAPEIKEANGALYSVNPQAPGGATASPLTPVGQSILIGTDPATGKGIFRNSVTGVESVGDNTLGAKPGTNRQTAYEQKLQEALAGGMSHSDAMAYANGTKAMGPQQAMVAAASAAARDAATASLSGGPPVDEKALRDQYYQEFTAPPVASSPGGGSPASSPSGTPTAAQLAAAKPFGGSRATVGTKDNPYMPVSQSQYDKLPHKAIYIGPDGQLRTKP